MAISLRREYDLPPPKNWTSSWGEGQESLKKTDIWIEQINQQFKSIIKVTRSDVVNRIIKDYSEKLSVKDLKSIKSDNFDDVKFARWIIEELKRKRKNGEGTSYDKVVMSVRPSLDIREPRKQKTKTSGINDLSTHGEPREPITKNKKVLSG